jgi:hydrogenase-4 component F
MIAVVVAAPLVLALATIAIQIQQTRQFARILLALCAALCPLALIHSLDELSLVFVAIVSVLGFAATVFSAGTFTEGWASADTLWSRKSVYFVLLGAFWSAMLLAVVANNFATLWLGISATTLTTAFLVGFSGEPAALEAAWKYLVLCSVGLGFVLLGMIVLGHISIANGIDPRTALSWAGITSGPAKITTVPLARLATALMLIGFATKAGLVPMHAWLPDAHSKSPAPISALLSGVLVSCALYAIMRTLSIGVALGSAPLLHAMLQWLGVLSIVVAGMLMLSQRDLKRLLAYSTVEHAGIVALALGFGGELGLFAALFHIVAHAFSKSSAFFAAGLVARERQTTELSRLHALWASGPPGRYLLGSLTALSGMPPFGIFLSEFLVVLAGIAARAWIPLGLGLGGLFVAFSALARAAVEIESGHPRVGTSLADLRVTLSTLERVDAAARASVFPRIASGVAAAVLLVAVGVSFLPWTVVGSRLRETATRLEMHK